MWEFLLKICVIFVESNRPDMRIVASMASMLEEPTRENEAPSSIHKLSLSEAASASLILIQTH